MKKPVTSPDRRRFLHIAGRYGFGTAVLAATGGYLWDNHAVAQTGADEAARQKAAKLTMLFATEYKIEDYVRYPVMQARFKENVETASKGQIYVKLHPAGQLGIGAALAQKVQAGTVQGGAVSLSNFSPFAPAVDLINIPYWCGENQKFANLVTSRAWDKEITPKVIARGYKPMFYFTVDPRTVSVRKGFGKVIRTPADMQGMKMRVPPSQLLQQFYRLAGANPTVVPWGETATAIKQGVADGLDPAVSALATFGFSDILETVSTVRSVPDAQMFAANANWYNQLPVELKVAFDQASEKTQIETFAQIEKARGVSMQQMAKGGAKFYNPTPAEFKQWVDQCGESRPEWNEFKIKLAGSLANFDVLKAAANTKGPITVSDYIG
ncbi:MAG: TRAP transporter substrate-binding protein [Burkholderiales bacterium]|jgi:TRAP-type C4-dicarboxylate transport system substrate-binding protein|nr:TRAP transporter substrate-binding protein [Burkholderiales bacterium]